MKKVIYRIQFRFEDSGNKELDRDDKISSILSSMENIDTVDKISAPSKGSIIEVGGKDFEVTSIKYAFNVEGNNVINTTIVGLTSLEKVEDSRKSTKESNDQLYAELKRMIGNKKGDDWTFMHSGGLSNISPKKNYFI